MISLPVPEEFIRANWVHYLNALFLIFSLLLGFYLIGTVYATRKVLKHCIQTDQMQIDHLKKYAESRKFNLDLID